MTLRKRDAPARYLIFVRDRGEVMTRSYGAWKTYTRDQVLAVRRRLKARGTEVLARKLPVLKARKQPVPTRTVGLAAPRKPAAASGAVRRASAPIARKPAKAPRVSARRAARDRWLETNRREVRRRTVFCEYSGQESGTECDHPFGRLGEPWASSHLILILLCGDHHRQVHRDRVARENVRRIALRRLRNYLVMDHRVEEVRLLFEDHLVHLPSRAVYEWLIDCARRNGIRPPGWKE